MFFRLFCFVCFKARIESVFAEFPGVLMRHVDIEMVCAQVSQSREPPPHLGGVFGASVLNNTVFKKLLFNHNHFH